jgi:PAS domain S-box-containing protein
MSKNKFKNKEYNDCVLQLIDLIPDPAIVVDGSGTIIAANSLVGKISGYTKEQLIGRSFAELSFVSEEYKKLLLENAKNRLEGSKIAPYEINITDKNGDIKCLEIRGNRIRNEGQLLDLAIFRDVTERSQNQKKLQADLFNSEEKFQGIANSIRDPIILVNEQAQITFWNLAAQRTFGYSSSEVMGKQIHDLIVPNSMCKEGKERIETSVRIFSETGTGYFTVGKVELIAKRKDGCEFPVELSISPIKVCNKWNAIGVIKDTTDRKKAEQKLRESDQRYHALFNEAPLGVLVVDPETASFVEFNDNAHTQLEYSREEFSKLTIQDIEAKESPDEIRRRIAEMVKKGGAEFETLQRTKNGSIKNILVTTRTIELSNKTFLHAIFHDITEIKKLQRELSKYSQRLEDLVKHRTEQLKETQAKLGKSERLAAIGELAGMVGHDLRNPLTGIKNAAYFLKKKGKAIPESQAIEMIETIDTCVNYSNKIVNDLLDYSRDMNLELKECSLKNLIIESLAMIKVPEKVEIANQIIDDTTVKVDQDKIKRVFTNIIKNGIDAMPNVGKLTIDCKETNGRLEISFADTGVGIPDEILPKLFTPLFTTKAQGMGFGLAICKRFAEAHGGTITVKTATGVGTTFIVTLPVEQKTKVGGEKIWIETPKFSLSTMTKT